MHEKSASNHEFRIPVFRRKARPWNDKGLPLYQAEWQKMNQDEVYVTTNDIGGCIGSYIDLDVRGVGRPKSFLRLVQGTNLDSMPVIVSGPLCPHGQKSLHFGAGDLQSLQPAKIP